MKIYDTITAIATPLGSGGVAIIRVSGENSEDIAQKIIETKRKKSLSELETHKLTLSDVHKPGDKDMIIDEALVAVMRAPNSFTGENIVEINCHGGYYVASSILNMLLECGARMAEPGEFTRRAFMNGKTDMLGAEATMDIIDAHSNLGLSNAAKALGGALSKKINHLREIVMEITANISATADYPEEVDPLTTEQVVEKLDKASDEIEDMINGFNTGKILRNGITTVIVGKPNVGKSSLLNAISRTDRAIVTDIPGTTRDTIEEYINLKGASLRLLDTAGIRTEGADAVEQIGIERTMENIEIADLCLFVIDCNKPTDERDIKITQALKGKTTIVILNKTDKTAKITANEISEKFGFEICDIIETATPMDIHPVGIDKLEDAIVKKFVLGKVNENDVFISNTRQRDSLIKANHSIALAKQAAETDMPFDLLYVDLEDALSALGEVVGSTVQEEIIDQVFERFCVGK